LKLFSLLFITTVVAQVYESEPENEYVIRGNSLILKCKIPSFVADFVDVTAWFDTTGYQYTTEDNLGTKAFQLQLQLIILGYSIASKSFKLIFSVKFDPCTRHVRLFLHFIYIYLYFLNWMYTNSVFWFSKDGKFVVLPSGELHIKNVQPEDGLKEYK